MKKVYVIVLLFFPFLTKGQNTIGLPEIRNFSKQVYGGGLQTWQMTQDSVRNMYFANNEGLIRYDGSTFKLFPLPNKTIVRSIALVEGKIWVGGQDELGYFQPDALGRLQYYDLTDKIERKFRNLEMYGLLFPSEEMVFTSVQHPRYYVIIRDILSLLQLLRNGDFWK